MDKETKKVLIIVGGVIVVVLLSIPVTMSIIANHFQKQQDLIEEFREKGKIVNVVVAKYDIPKEATIAADMVRMTMVPFRTLQSGDLTSLDSVIGKKATKEIFKDQRLNADSLKILQEINNGSVSKQEQSVK